LPFHQCRIADPAQSSTTKQNDLLRQVVGTANDLFAQRIVLTCSKIASPSLEFLSLPAVTTRSAAEIVLARSYGKYHVGIQFHAQYLDRPDQNVCRIRVFAQDGVESVTIARMGEIILVTMLPGAATIVQTHNGDLSGELQWGLVPKVHEGAIYEKGISISCHLMKSEMWDNWRRFLIEVCVQDNLVSVKHQPGFHPNLFKYDFAKSCTARDSAGSPCKPSLTVLSSPPSVSSSLRAEFSGSSGGVGVRRGEVGGDIRNADGGAHGVSVEPVNAGRGDNIMHQRRPSGVICRTSESTPGKAPYPSRIPAQSRTKTGNTASAVRGGHGMPTSTLGPAALAGRAVPTVSGPPTKTSSMEGRCPESPGGVSELRRDGSGDARNASPGAKDVSAGHAGARPDDNRPDLRIPSGVATSTTDPAPTTAPSFSRTSVQPRTESENTASVVQRELWVSRSHYTYPGSETPRLVGVLVRELLWVTIRFDGRARNYSGKDMLLPPTIELLDGHRIRIEIPGAVTFRMSATPRTNFSVDWTSATKDVLILRTDRFKLQVFEASPNKERANPGDTRSAYPWIWSLPTKGMLYELTQREGQVEILIKGRGNVNDLHDLEAKLSR